MLFFVPILGLHTLMDKKKQDAIKEAKMKWWIAVKQEDPMNTRVRSSVVRRIEKIPTWPFDTSRLLEVTGYVVVPFLVWIISYLTR